MRAKGMWDGGGWKKEGGLMKQNTETSAIGISYGFEIFNCIIIFPHRRLSVWHGGRLRTQGSLSAHQKSSINRGGLTTTMWWWWFGWSKRPRQSIALVGWKKSISNSIFCILSSTSSPPAWWRISTKFLVLEVLIPLFFRVSSQIQSNKSSCDV